MRFLIFGDVVGKPGREAVSRALPKLRDEHEPDSIIVNVENIAHGKGISPATIKEASSWQADVYTTGDHAWDNAASLPLLDDASVPLIRPANYPPGVPGRGYHVYTIGTWQVAVINLQGQVFFRNHPLNPFFVLDELLKERPIKEANVVLVDFHASATSEKRALGWYADGRVAAVFGTHTHVPTADAQILPQGTGYISDVGMNGGYHSVIGVKPSGSIKLFLTQLKPKFEPVTEGPWEINAVLIDIDANTGTATDIALIRKILNNKE